MLQRINLDQGWQFKQSSTLEDGIAKEYLPVAGFPTVSHIDLLHHGLIPDPYIDANELKCLWVNDADWTYQTTKVGPVALADGEKAVLVLEGLDTVVDVYFNDEHILFSKNMHISHRVDITHLVSDKNEPSTLELRFRAAPAFARTERQKIGYRGNKNPETDVHFGGPERLFLRKAQYHWGWDWGPAVNTCGPWKPIYIETFTSRVNDFLVTQQVAEDLKTAEIRISGSVEYVSGEVEVTIEVADPSGNIVKEDMVKTSDGLFTTTISLSDIQLWYPHTHGSQPLYTVKATLSSHSSKCLTIGLRRLRILQHPLKDVEGSSFLFEINNIRLFCGGSCWIPGDFMLPRMTRSRYEEWLLLAKHGNQIMIRVWGGGIIESDDFYDICDREGILVWQDFLFACGNYPASQDFIENIRVEAEQAVRRVGYHPSLVIWAGNNEDYMLADRWEWELDYSDEKGPWDKTNFPAREIYERVLPAIVEKLGGDVPYWRSSPYGGKFANDTTVGDGKLAQCNI
jgi:beta-mannosidase